MLAVLCMLCVAQATAACAALLTTKVTTTCIAAAVCICCCMQCCKTILSAPSLFKVLSTCRCLCCSLGFATLEYLSCLRHVPKVNPMNMLPLADSVCLCMVIDCLIKTMNAAAISGPCASLACQFMLGLQVTEAFVLSLPVYLLMYEKVQSDDEQHAMVQQARAARDFTPGAYTAVSTRYAPEQRSAAAAAAARIKDQTNTPAMTPLEERNALMGGPNKKTRNHSNARKARKQARKQAARRARLDCIIMNEPGSPCGTQVTQGSGRARWIGIHRLSAQDPAPQPMETLSAGSAASLSDSSAPRAARSIQSCKSRIE